MVGGGRTISSGAIIYSDDDESMTRVHVTYPSSHPNISERCIASRDAYSSADPLSSISNSRARDVL